jgi:hypothetical protein
MMRIDIQKVRTNEIISKMLNAAEATNYHIELVDINKYHL